MPVELRKRKEAPPAPARPAKKKAAPKEKKPAAEKTVVEKATEAVTETVTETVEAVKDAVVSVTNGATTGIPKVGDTIDLSAFGGEIETNDGNKTTFAKLVEESKGGVVLFTYPKASTPGCTTQVCLFRDSYEPLTATGYSIFGLSNDSPKANTTFKTKQKLPYTLLCDPAQTLISAIGLKKTPKGTTRGVFVVDKSGKVLAAEPGGPAATVEVVKKLVGSGEVKDGDVEAAKTADEVADTAEKIDA
ncbi:AhpC-TSA-domain-containing protein [Dothidotthia symphoricarpi CBS 119687]|uniref:thioredoxin-dependent peroxiredoxin n=1 Tax=Dothidotthia symphoricarpi CBS 119687 TaxID=1392245 RepID=A0A6A6A8Q7_9PLEO|nr:AhpC-TSA-domain-containing protein [Dothidotthia symphoricarpi CBS 119687]KAF2127198.1 AhpC-TSA-domain-containing protein [Dothidotthia symphoricarpi CBS 119687]